MLHRLCGSPSIPLSFILANVLPRWITYCVCCGTDGSYPPTPSNHRLRRGLPGYLILFAPHAFEPQRQLQSSKPPSPLVFLLISTHFTATLGIPLTSPALQPDSFQSSSGVEGGEVLYLFEVEMEFAEDFLRQRTHVAFGAAGSASQM